ncbi:MAG: hypothetical protein ACE5GW_01330 [Planctomycetota bacterium]
MILWNKEKVIAALSLVVLLAAAAWTARSWTTGRQEVHLQEPAPSSEGGIGTPLPIQWIEAGALAGGARDPFQPISEWRSAPRDPLPLPPLGALTRRVPLPAPIAGATMAPPPRERSMPEALEPQEGSSP